MSEPSSSRGSKRRLDDLLGERLNANQSPPHKKCSELQQYRNELNILMMEKEEFIRKQRYSSLLIDPRRIDEDGIMARFSPLYQQVSQLLTEPEDHPEHLNLIKDIVKGSIIIEWPRSVYGVHKTGHGERTEIDQAPLILRARKIVKPRTRQPTMRIKVYALTETAEQQRESGAPQLLEACFRSSLTKPRLEIVGEKINWRNTTIAGRMFLTQREDTTTPKNKYAEVMANKDGQLLASQTAPDYQHFEIRNNINRDMPSTTFKYENNVLCATFSEIGVFPNSLLERRKFTNRYVIANEVFINISGLLIEHVFTSQPFLIAITDHIEDLLKSIIWSRMMDTEHYERSECQAPITYGVLRETARQFVKSQNSRARSLTDRELLHLQAMIFLPLVNKCGHEVEVENLERRLFCDTDEISDCETNVARKMADIDKMIEAKRRLKEKLLSEVVKDHAIIRKNDLMGATCVSLLDGRSELLHTPWQWLFKVTKLILDVDRRLLPSTSLPKKPFAVPEKFSTMINLFNKGLVSLFSVVDAHATFKQLRDGEFKKQDNIMMRFCEENAGHISFALGLDANEKLMMGSIDGEMIKDFEHGLAEALMDEEHLCGRLVRISVHPYKQTNRWFETIRKRSLFDSYQSLPKMDGKTPFYNELMKRIISFSVAEEHMYKFNSTLFYREVMERIIPSQVAGVDMNNANPVPRIVFKRKRPRGTILCAICYQDLLKKVTVSLDTCRHEFHRKCLLDWCESGVHQPEADEGDSALPAPCPQCDTQFHKVTDEFDCEISTITYWGPTAEPSSKFLTTLLERNNVTETIDALHVLTSSRLQWASNKLVLARKSNKCAEYINDLISEKDKMQKRHTLLHEMQQKCSITEEQIRAHLAVNHVDTIEDAAAAASAQSPTAMGAPVHEEDRCGLCLDDLPTKRTATLQECRCQKFHRTCIIDLAEHGQDISWGSTIESSGLACCICRKESDILNEDGSIIPQILAVENCREFLLDNGTNASNEVVARMNLERRAIVSAFGSLAQDKREALRYKRSKEYVEDIDEQMEKMRKRLQLVDRFLLLVSIQAITRLRTEREERNVDMDDTG